MMQNVRSLRGEQFIDSAAELCEIKLRRMMRIGRTQGEFVPRGDQQRKPWVQSVMELVSVVEKER